MDLENYRHDEYTHQNDEVDVTVARASAITSTSKRHYFVFVPVVQSYETVNTLYSFATFLSKSKETVDHMFLGETGWRIEFRNTSFHLRKLHLFRLGRLLLASEVKGLCTVCARGHTV